MGGTEADGASQFVFGPQADFSPAIIRLWIADRYVPCRDEIAHELGLGFSPTVFEEDHDFSERAEAQREWTRNYNDFTGERPDLYREAIIKARFKYADRFLLAAGLATSPKAGT